MKKPSRPLGTPDPNLAANIQRSTKLAVDDDGSQSPSLRSLAETRLLAIKLQEQPIPQLTKRALIMRWKVGKDVVRNTLRAHGVDPGHHRDLTIPLTDALLCEGVEDPLTTWVMASDEDRKLLEASLLTPRDLRDADSRVSKLHLETYRRHAREGRKTSIRIGKQHRFRSTPETIKKIFKRSGKSPK